MEHLPPVGWAEVATKSDLEVLRAATKAGLAGLREAMDAGFEGAALRLESTNSSMLAEMHRSLRNQAIAAMTVFGILNGVVFAALKLA